MWLSYNTQDDIRYRVTGVLIWLIRRVNTMKDQSLAYRLHAVADEYDRRPTGEWSKR